MTDDPQEKKTDKVEDMLEQLGLPRDFLKRLVLEDDWSFIIKIHALFESLVSEGISRELRRKEIRKVVDRLAFGGDAGKVALASSLGLLNDDQRNYLNRLSEVRNFYVHNIKNISLTLVDHLAALKGSKKSAIKKHCLELIPNHMRIEGGISLWDKSPRLTIYLAAYCCLLDIEYVLGGYKVQALIDALKGNTKTSSLSSLMQKFTGGE